MGNFFSGKDVEEAFRKNQDVIQEINKIKLERQIQMRNQLRERQLAFDIAKSRELFYWVSSFYFVSLISLGISFRRTKKPMYLAPLVPLTFINAYITDLAYGNKVHRITAEAEIIMQFEPELLELPCGLPTASTIDLARLETDEKKFLHPAIPQL